VNFQLSTCNLPGARGPWPVVLLPCLILLAIALGLSAQTNSISAKRSNNPEMVEADGTLRLDFGDEILVLPRGLQPSLLRTASGALIVQAQIPEKPFPSSRMHYPSALETRISRDDGKTWLPLPLPPNDNGVNLEGSVTQLRDGTILALDTYIT